MIPGLAGSLVGLLGALISRFLDANQTNKITQATILAQRELEQIQLEREKLALETEKLRNTAAVAVAANSADATRMDASFAADKDTSEIGFINILRGVTRPLVTWIAVALLCYINIYVIGFDEYNNHAEEVILATIEIVSLVITWWFGARPSQFRLEK